MVGSAIVVVLIVIGVAAAIIGVLVSRRRRVQKGIAAFAQVSQDDHAAADSSDSAAFELEELPVSTAKLPIALDSYKDDEAAPATENATTTIPLDSEEAAAPSPQMSKKSKPPRITKE